MLAPACAIVLDLHEPDDLDALQLPVFTAAPTPLDAIALIMSAVPLSDPPNHARPHFQRDGPGRCASGRHRRRRPRQHRRLQVHHLRRHRGDAAAIPGHLPAPRPEGHHPADARGINMFVSGPRGQIDQFLQWVRGDARFADLEVKESLSTEQSHKRMLVKIKKEIITMRMPLIKPEEGRAPFVDAATLKRWLDAGVDDAGKPVVMVDTRNDFEVDVGTFNNTVDYRIKKFTEFPEVIAEHQADFE